MGAVDSKVCDLVLVLKHVGMVADEHGCTACELGLVFASMVVDERGCSVCVGLSSWC